eukprot:scaffold1931_cov390-Prasinococcus_capsulatus_cf.AAC.8
MGWAARLDWAGWPRACETDSPSCFGPKLALGRAAYRYCTCVSSRCIINGLLRKMGSKHPVYEYRVVYNCTMSVRAPRYTTGTDMTGARESRARPHHQPANKPTSQPASQH